MKKVILAIALIGTLAVLTGCQSQSKSSGFDNADSASFDEATDTQAGDIGNPPVPPEPTEANQ